MCVYLGNGGGKNSREKTHAHTSRGWSERDLGEIEREREKGFCFVETGTGERYIFF